MKYCKRVTILTTLFVGPLLIYAAGCYIFSPDQCDPNYSTELPLSNQTQSAPANPYPLNTPDPNLATQTCPTEPNIPALINVFKTTLDLNLLDQTARSLINYGPDAVPYLQQLKIEPNLIPRTFAVLTMFQIDNSLLEESDVDILILALQSQHRTLIIHSAYVLGRLGAPARKAVPALVRNLNSGDFSIRASSLNAIGRIGPDAIPFLIQDLNHEDKFIQCYAAWSLVHIDVNTATQKAMPSLLENLKYPELDIRKFVMMIFEYMGPYAAPAIPDLIIALNDPSKDIRLSAIAILAQLGPQSQPAVPKLIELINDQNFNIRFYSIHALADIGPNAHQAIPHLKLALLDPDPDIRQAAQNALNQIEK